MIDFIPSLMVGISQVAVGHPFDTAKVLIQNNKKWLGLPPSRYYYGWQFPMGSSLVLNCTLFPIYESTIKYTNNHFISGGLGGFIAAPMMFSFDYSKIKRQTDQIVRPKDIIYSKGLPITVFRQTAAMGVYFSTYKYFKNNNYPIFISGGIAGLANWTFSYPFDVIKSRQISQQISFQNALEMGSLWRGYSICAVRALLVNAVNFSVYEGTKKLMKC